MPLRIPSIAAGVLAAGVLSAAPALAAGLSVGIDMTKPVRFEREAANVVVGNPAIADIYVQNSHLVFVLGRSYGATNLVALDDKGVEIANIPITVTSVRGQSVTLLRGPDGQITYACGGRCEPALAPGDQPQHFRDLMEAVTAKTGQADSVAENANKGR